MKSIEEKNKKIELIKEIERSVGFESFKMKKNSPEEEIDEVLRFIYTASTELTDNFMPKIEKLLKDIN